MRSEEAQRKAGESRSREIACWRYSARKRARTGKAPVTLSKAASAGLRSDNGVKST